MLNFLSVGARLSVRPSKANLEALYISLNGCPFTPMILLTLIMRPFFLAFMPGKAALRTRMTPKKFASNRFCALSIGMHSNTLTRPCPALFTKCGGQISNNKHESLLREDRENLYSKARSFVPPFGGSAKLGRSKVNDCTRLFAQCNLPSGFPHMRCYTFALPS